MRKRLFNLVNLVIVVCLCFSVSATALAAPAESESTQAIFSKELASMTNAELNALIDSVTELAESGVVMSSEAIKQAWLAAAEIARNKGYPCAATLVEHSVKNFPYTELVSLSGGLFERKIKPTSVYKNYLADIKAGREGLGKGKVLQFKKSINADLFFSLHRCTCTTTKSTLGGYTTYTITINDTYDFEVDLDYDDLFASIVNNWGWLC